MRSATAYSLVNIVATPASAVNSCGTLICHASTQIRQTSISLMVRRSIHTYAYIPTLTKVKNLLLLVFGAFHVRSLPDGEWRDFLPNVVAKARALEEACSTLLTTAGWALRHSPDFGMLSALFSFSSLTGIPVCDANTIFRSPPISPWRPKKLVHPVGFRLGSTAFSLFLAVTQRRTLAKLAHLPEHDVEMWSSLTSRSWFSTLTKLLAKVTHGKASPEEESSLVCALVALLFISELRSTHVFQSAQRALLPLIALHPVEWIGLLSGLEILKQYTLGHAERLSFPERRKYLCLWIRHWLGKFYDRRSHDAWVIVAMCTFLSSMDVGEAKDSGESADQDKLFGTVEKKTADENAADQDAAEGGAGSWGVDRTGYDGFVGEDTITNEDTLEDASNEHEEDGGRDENDVGSVGIELICILLPKIAKGGQGGNGEVLRGTLNSLACKDLARLFRAGPLSSAEPLDVRAKRDAVLEYPKRITASNSDAIKGVMGVMEHTAGLSSLTPEFRFFRYLSTTWIQGPR